MARILVADDDPLIRDMVSATLQRAGHEFDLVSTGQQALGRLRDSQFDLVIADIFMPDGTGIELLISMRAKRIDIPFICISGGDGDLFRPYVTTMVSLGAYTVLRKPFTPSKLLDAVSYAIIGATAEHA
jgi:two-component system, OmpR family, response regulator